MSLNKRREPKAKKITIIGSKDDIRTLGDTLQQVADMFNIDLDIGNEDLPQRITIRDRADPDALDYPRTAKVLKRLGKELSTGPDEGTAPIYFGSFDWKLYEPRYAGASPATQAPEIVKVLQSISEGRSVGGLPAMSPNKHFAGLTFMEDFDTNMSRNQHILPENLRPGGLFDTLQPKWVYIQNIDIAPVRSRKSKGKKQHDSGEELVNMEIGRLQGTPGLESYPADLGEIKTGSFGKEEATQGYVGVFRGDYDFDLDQAIPVSDATWKNFIRRIPPDILSKELQTRPRTIGDLLERFFAYNIASAMKMKNATVKPVAPGRAKIYTELMEDVGEGRPAPGQPPTRPALGTKVLYSAIVVGTGKYRPQTHSVSQLAHTDVPGWV